jgi:hypothetical protein
VDTLFTNSIHVSSLVFLLLHDNTWILSGPGGSITDFYCRQRLNTNDPQNDHWHLDPRILSISELNYFKKNPRTFSRNNLIFFKNYLSMSGNFTFFLVNYKFSITLKISIVISRFIIKWRIAKWKWNYLDKSFKKKSWYWWVKNPPGCWYSYPNILPPPLSTGSCGLDRKCAHLHVSTLPRDLTHTPPPPPPKSSFYQLPSILWHSRFLFSKLNNFFIKF